MQRNFLVISILTLVLGTAQADPFRGQVYGVYPEGVMIQQAQSSVLVPVEQATFQVGGVNLSYSKLVPGQVVDIFVPEPYLPRLVPIADPYAWKMKYHPNHPHGGPPGQMKKYYQQHPGNGNGNGNGNGKGKGNKGKGKH